MRISERSVVANGLTFGLLEAGDGPLALCLHGFPDTAFTWRHLLPQLADAGYHAVAPFLRGYAPTAIPVDGAYQSGALAADANALHGVLGGDGGAVLIGHDWGAMASYLAAVRSPANWRRLVTIAVPPPMAVAAAFLSYAQLKRSFYIFLFQTALAEVAVGQHDFAFIEGLWADWSPGYDASVDLVHLKDALRDPANLSAAIGYYRAMLDPSRHLPAYATEQGGAVAIPPQPTLYLHGSADGALGVELVAGAEAYLSAESHVEVLQGVGHFLHLEDPDRVNSRIIDWLAT